MEKFLNISEIEVSYKNPVPKNQRQRANSSSSIAGILRPFFKNYMEHKEAFYILLLNNANEILGISRIGEGSVTGVMVDMRIIFQIALKAHAVGIILAHNHPSGTLRPSQADIKLTERIKLAGELFDIKVLDHIILTEHSYFSFADEHLL